MWYFSLIFARLTKFPASHAVYDPKNLASLGVLFLFERAGPLPTIPRLFFCFPSLPGLGCPKPEDAGKPVDKTSAV